MTETTPTPSPAVERIMRDVVRYAVADAEAYSERTNPDPLVYDTLATRRDQIFTEIADGVEWLRAVVAAADEVCSRLMWRVGESSYPGGPPMPVPVIVPSISEEHSKAALIALADALAASREPIAAAPAGEGTG